MTPAGPFERNRQRIGRVETMTDRRSLGFPTGLGISLAACALVWACVSGETQRGGAAGPDPTTMSRIAESYVRLVLAMGEHAPDYVDAYYGPAAWRDEVREQVKDGALNPAAIRDQAAAIIREMEGMALPAGGGDEEEMTRLRHGYLLGQSRAVSAYAGMLLGDKHTFDEESRLLYDAVAPHNDEEHFRAILAQLDARLPPGAGTIGQRYERFHAGFVIPRDKLDPVFRAAIAEARRRVAQRMQLPEKESFEISYVTEKPWSGYNWYKGDGHSLIEINTDLPIYIDRAIDLACHEGYPGHHVYNALLEESLVRRRGWVEFSVYPLFSPQSLIAEGSANFGIDVAFPRPERIAFEKEVLFPLAGLDPARADAYYEIHDLVAKLAYAGNEAARRYLDGAIDADAATAWLTEFTLTSPERARQRIGFMDKYRSYVINYNLGKDLVRTFIEARGGTSDRADARWTEFEKLLSSPRLPSGLR